MENDGKNDKKMMKNDNKMKIFWNTPQILDLRNASENLHFIIIFSSFFIVFPSFSMES